MLVELRRDPREAIIMVVVGGNPCELPHPPGPVPKKGPAVPGPPGVAHGCPPGDQRRPAVSGSDPLGVRAGQGSFASRTVGRGDGGVGAAHGPGLQEGQAKEPAVNASSAQTQGLSSGTTALDPLGTLVQGMAQLQAAMSQSLTNKAKDVEVVKPGLAELPRLPDLSASSAIDFGDWLHGLQNHMGDLSNSSSQWWTEVLGCLTKFYEAYLAASHVGKPALRAADFDGLQEPQIWDFSAQIPAS